MLPIPCLDDEGFGEILEQAKGMIPRFAPQWTDYNHHDPGITMLELFAFLKETQQYHLDQIGPRNRLKFLKLLGQTPATAQGATLWCEVSGGQGVLPQGTRLLAGDIPFELTRPADLLDLDLRDGFVNLQGRIVPYQITRFGKEQKLRLEPFGNVPEVGNQLYLRLGQVPKEGQALGLYFRLEHDTVCPRNPVAPGFTPLTTLVWEHHTPQGWERLKLVEDGTYGLLFDGEVVVKPDKEFAFTTIDNTGKHGCWIRVTLAGGHYDVPPVLRGMFTNMVSAVQQQTTALLEHHKVEKGIIVSHHALTASGKYQVLDLQAEGLYHICRNTTAQYDGASGCTTIQVETTAQEVVLCSYETEFAVARSLGSGDGFPNQMVPLPKDNLVAPSVAILVQRVETTGYELWKQVPDFDTATPEDTCYILDAKAGVLHFGDCEHGLAPEGKILVAGLAQTKGVDGNIKANAINGVHLGHIQQLPKAVPDTLTLYNPDNAQGGAQGESEVEALARCRQSLQKTHRAVTYADYETLVKEAPGLRIDKCKAVDVTDLARLDGTFPDDCVRIVVEPYGPEQLRTLSEGYRTNLMRYLTPRRMLGTTLDIVSPVYVRLDIYAEIITQPYYVDAKERIAKAVTDFFATASQFGAPVQYSVLYGIVDTLDCVARIETLTIDAQGKGISRSLSGDVLLPYNGLPILRGATYQIRPGE